jgi:dipeptidyl aminopeptidase/acylaminoacyl peptidase
MNTTRRAPRNTDGVRHLWSRAIPLAIVLAAAVSEGCHAQRPTPPPLGVDEALRIRDFLPLSPIAISPDDQIAAFTVWEPHRQPGGARDFIASGAPRTSLAADVYTVDVRTGETNNLTQGNGTSWGPAWSPDGTLLAFYSDRAGQAQVWIWHRSTGVLRRLAEAVVRPFFAFETVRWSADGRHVITKLKPEHSEDDRIDAIRGLEVQEESSLTSTGSTGVVYTSLVHDPSETAGIRPIDYGFRFFSDLGVISLETGQTARPVTNRHITGYWPAPVGDHVVFAALKGQVGASSHAVVDELGILEIGAIGTPRIVVPDIHRGLHFQFMSWSPNGQKLAFIDERETGANCLVLDVASGDLTNVTSGTNTRFSSLFRSPIWHENGQRLYLLSRDTVWRADLDTGALDPAFTAPGRRIVQAEVLSGAATGMVLLLRNPSTQRMGFAHLDFTTERVSLFPEADKYLGGAFRIAATEKVMIYVSEDATHPPDLWKTMLHGGDSRQLTFLNPNLASERFGRTRLLTWNSLDGQTLHGALLLPAGYREGERYPMIVRVYGGGFLSHRVNRFGLMRAFGADNMQVLATRGYAVLAPDAPLDTETPVADLAKTVLPGVNKAVEVGIADPERLGIMGHSYGGYSTVALLTQTNRFRAGLSAAGHANLISRYGTMTRGGHTAIEWAETGQGRMGGTIWDRRAAYIENSPFLYLDRVESPLLMIHGSEDQTVPAFLADQTFVGLRRLGKDVVYVKYIGEEHWEGQWSYANSRDYLERMLSWFDEHLRVRQQQP